MITCYADPNPIYMPAMRLILSITNSDPALVQTTFDHGYLTGQFVRLYIGTACGMWQADKLTGEITVLSGDTFTININTIPFDAFALPVAPLPQDDICSYVVPIGEKNDMFTAAVHNVL